MLEELEAELPDAQLAPIKVVARILRAARLLDHEIGRALAPFGLSNREFDVLSALRRSGPPYARTASELGHAILFSSGGLTKLLERLEQAGLVTRERDSEDRRVVYVKLTDAGIELQEAAASFELDQEERMLSGLDADQREALGDLLQALLAGFELNDSRWPLQR
jgi:DNA-binding MarR family transcriptional regulator